MASLFHYFSRIKLFQFFLLLSLMSCTKTNDNKNTTPKPNKNNPTAPIEENNPNNIPKPNKENIPENENAKVSEKFYKNVVKIVLREKKSPNPSAEECTGWVAAPNLLITAAP